MTDILNSIKPLYVIPVIVVAVLIVGGFFLLGGGDEEKKTAGADPSLGFAEGDPSQLPGRKRRAPKQAPVVRSGLLDEARREGRLAVAQARGTIVGPSRVRIRVSASPRQSVTVNWQLGCFRDRRARVGRGTYRTRSPDLRAVNVPMAGAKSCIATASAQLTKVEGKGLVKVSVIAG
ncbi:MAG: hypothetical protein ACRDLN_13250 [Solirubrobacteraceae bacterium]